MKIELHLAKNGYNSTLKIDGKDVFFSRLAILVDSPGPTKMQIAVPLQKNPGLVLDDESIEIVGNLEPRNLFIDILGEPPEPTGGRGMRPEPGPDPRFEADETGG